MKLNRTENSELFSAIIHEIKNSLNPVINLSALLQRNSGGRLTDDENGWLTAINRNGNRILSLVEEFSFLKKIPAPPGSLTSESISVTKTAEEAYTSSRALTVPGSGRLIVDGADSIINTDKEMFRRMLENVFHYFLIADGGRDIYLSSTVAGSILNAVVSRKSGTAAALEGAPQGKDTLPESGFSATRVIWLQFAVIYINSLRGIASFNYDSDGDAVFSFSIPFSAADLSAPEKQRQNDTPVRHGAVHEFVILIIDDDIDNITPVTAIVENEFNGMATVHHAESGSRGLDILETLKPDIILLDLTLPDISGLSLVRNIKHLFLRKNIPVIAFTALDIANDMEKLRKAGFDDVIKKPFSIETFINTINRWVGI